MAKLKEKVAMQNVATKPTDLKRPTIAPDAWKAELINKSHSQANLPMQKIGVRSNGSQESIRERNNNEVESAGEYYAKKKSHFSRRKIKSNALMYPPTSEKKKESGDHDTVKGYLQQQRQKRFEQDKISQNKNYGGYVSNFTNYDDLKSESGASILQRSHKPVADINLRKLLADPNINETERMYAVKLRTEQIEKRAKMEEQKLRLNGPAGGS